MPESCNAIVNHHAEALDGLMILLRDNVLSSSFFSGFSHLWWLAVVERAIRGRGWSEPEDWNKSLRIGKKYTSLSAGSGVWPKLIFGRFSTLFFRSTCRKTLWDILNKDWVFAVFLRNGNWRKSPHFTWFIRNQSCFNVVLHETISQLSPLDKEWLIGNTGEMSNQLFCIQLMATTTKHNFW